MNFTASENYPDELFEPKKEKIKRKKSYVGDEYFLMRKRGMIRNPAYRAFMGGKMTVYEYIWANIIRDKMRNDKYDIKENYYDKGFLAYCSTHRYIANECFMSTGTVIKYIGDFEAKGIIKIEKIGVKPTKKDVRGVIIDRRSTVFILGTWHKEIVEKKEKIRECYYIDDKFYE